MFLCVCTLMCVWLCVLLFDCACVSLCLLHNETQTHTHGRNHTHTRTTHEQPTTHTQTITRTRATTQTPTPSNARTHANTHTNTRTHTTHTHTYAPTIHTSANAVIYTGDVATFGLLLSDAADDQQCMARQARRDLHNNCSSGRSIYSLNWRFIVSKILSCIFLVGCSNLDLHNTNGRRATQILGAGAPNR